ncbi:hypothetical protein BB559_007077 [Furculomyces boomerangus]|uniref:Multifunctional tryptophan biosynthesis protein n=1 Tax=Furculomyces boomerangus TaxID=61424 RepID=A0A2T9XZ28_9FUNG|nr:hypothetical protein BB559_007077 [Furculomyces boomerangus]
MSVILIDNYDSFTWNVYEYLNKAGAKVGVYRNDKISVKEIEALNPTHLVLSPGPGHPREDSGVCYDAISHFAGKIPIMGVCLGLQCMYDLYGGKVSFAGEIIHGKTDRISHDGKGVYTDIPQNFSVTRYHSLACTLDNVPEELEITSYTDSGVSMGARHKTYTVEGVQYHPESFLSEYGVKMFANFLALSGGTWAENPQFMPALSKPIQQAPKEDILLKIHKQRLIDIQQAKELPGRSIQQLEQIINIPGVAPSPIDFVERLRRIKSTNPNMVSVISEVKRASPSKGDISLNANAVEIGLEYAMCGASAISVLTEPTWFKGRLEDMLQIRLAIGHALGNEKRPAILRKDFIVDKYQIAEARLFGADAILLIVSMLDLQQLTELLEYTHSLGMEALVEVNNEQEVGIAINANAKIIGVNNRNLRSFDVDIDTTSKLSAGVPEHILFIALSGVLEPSDALAFKDSNTGAIVVGEGLMKSKNKKQFISDLSSIFC